MKSLTKPTGNKGKKTIRVIKNAHSPAEQQAIGDRWVENKGLRMTLAETLAYAAQQNIEQSTK